MRAQDFLLEYGAGALQGVAQFRAADGEFGFKLALKQFDLREQPIGVFAH